MKTHYINVFMLKPAVFFQTPLHLQGFLGRGVSTGQKSYLANQRIFQHHVWMGGEDDEIFMR